MEKQMPPECDGIRHHWSHSIPMVCLGCGISFTDPEALKREIELRKQGGQKHAS